MFMNGRFRSDKGNGIRSDWNFILILFGGVSDQSVLVRLQWRMSRQTCVMLSNPPWPVGYMHDRPT